MESSINIFSYPRIWSFEKFRISWKTQACAPFFLAPLSIYVYIFLWRWGSDNDEFCRNTIISSSTDESYCARASTSQGFPHWTGAKGVILLHCWVLAALLGYLTFRSLLCKLTPPFPLLPLIITRHWLPAPPSLSYVFHHTFSFRLLLARHKPDSYHNCSSSALA